MPDVKRKQKQNTKTGKGYKRLVGLADLHCGHRVGLTPPNWRSNQANKYCRPQTEMWDIYTEIIDDLKPIDYLICNGDAIDGDGGRSGGTELIVRDRREQAKMAIECIDYAEAKKHAFQYGTPYHSGNLEDFEEVVADYFDAPISGQEQYNINGVIIDCKHKIGNTSIPHGKGSAISREKLWNLVWADYQEQENADILIRSHVHWCWFCGDSQWLGIVTPALQGQGTKYGSRQCSGHVDFGLVCINIFDNGDYEWDCITESVEYHRRKAVKL